MNDLHTQLITVFLGFFAIMNPIANTAAFAGLAGNKDSSEQLRIAARALIITFVVILLFSLLGKMIFHLFGITLPALRITGGVLVFLIGYPIPDYEGDFWTRSYLAGDLGGTRTDLAVAGVARQTTRRTIRR